MLFRSISKRGAFDLIMGSRKPQAKAMKDRILEILDTIETTGCYIRKENETFSFPGTEEPRSVREDDITLALRASLDNRNRIGAIEQKQIEHEKQSATDREEADRNIQAAKEEADRKIQAAKEEADREADRKIQDAKEEADRKIQAVREDAEREIKAIREEAEIRDQQLRASQFSIQKIDERLTDVTGNRPHPDDVFAAALARTIGWRSFRSGGKKVHPNAVLSAGRLAGYRAKGFIVDRNIEVLQGNDVKTVSREVFTKLGADRFGVEIANKYPNDAAGVFEFIGDDGRNYRCIRRYAVSVNNESEDNCEEEGGE